MKLSGLREAFSALGHRVDRLVQGVGAADFAREVDALRGALLELQKWTKPRGGGSSFEVDIEPYLCVGGAPAFMRDHAPLLLAAATTLRNAEQALAERLAPAGTKPLPARPDLAVPLAAPLDYTRDDVAKIQRVFRFLYSKRAYRKLASGTVWVRSLDEAYLPPEVKTIAQLSKRNLSALRRALAPLGDAERALYDALRALPFTLKHATAADKWATIYNARLLFSKDALIDWNIAVPTYTPRSDELYKQDVDFTFFRVEVGAEDWVSRFGAGEDTAQTRVVFDWSQLLEDGWVTLHDMLAPLGGAEPRVELRTRDDAALQRTSVPDMALEGGAPGGKAWIHWKWQHEYPDGRAPRKVHILDEVFHGPDVLEGIVLSALRDLRELPTLQREALAHRRDMAYMHWLVKSLFRIEAKLPSAFRLEPADVLRTYGDPPPTRATLGAATRTPDTTTLATPRASARRDRHEEEEPLQG